MAQSHFHIVQIIFLHLPNHIQLQPIVPLAILTKKNTKKTANSQTKVKQNWRKVRESHKLTENNANRNDSANKNTM